MKKLSKKFISCFQDSNKPSALKDNRDAGKKALKMIKDTLSNIG